MDDLYPNCGGCGHEADGFRCRVCYAPLCQFCACDEGGLCAWCAKNAAPVERWESEALLEERE